MSHVAEIKIEIKDLDALQAACKRIGAELRRGQTTYAWYGHSVGDYPLPAGFAAKDLGKCDHAIRVPGAAYEVGVVRRRDGKPGYTLLWDHYRAGGLAQALGGVNAGRLVQAYGVEAARRAARLAGYDITETQAQDGAVVLRVTR